VPLVKLGRKTDRTLGGPISAYFHPQRSHSGPGAESPGSGMNEGSRLLSLLRPHLLKVITACTLSMLGCAGLLAIPIIVRDILGKTIAGSQVSVPLQTWVILGTWLAVIYGVGGMLGLYAGGELATRRAKNQQPRARAPSASLRAGPRYTCHHSTTLVTTQKDGRQTESP